MDHLNFIYNAENNTKQSRLKFRRFEAVESCTHNLIRCLVTLYELCNRKQEGQLPALVQIRQDLSDALIALETIEIVTKEEGASDRKNR